VATTLQVGVETASPQVFFHQQGMLEGRESPLLTIGAITEATGDTHGDGELIQGQAVRIDQFPGMADLAAQPQGLDGVLASIVAGVLLEGSGDAEILAAIRHLADLGSDETRGQECRMNIPARATPGVAGEADP